MALNLQTIIDKEVQVAKEKLLLDLVATARMEGDKKWQTRLMKMVVELQVDEVELEHNER